MPGPRRGRRAAALASAKLLRVAASRTPLEARAEANRAGVEMLLVVRRSGRVEGVLERETLDRAARHEIGDACAVGDLVVEEIVEIGAQASLADLRREADRSGFVRGVVRLGVGGDARGVLARDALAGLPPDLRGFSDPRATMQRPVDALLRRIARAARGRGGSAWLVGGVVRDVLLGRPPSDLDVAVDGVEPFRVVADLGGELTEEHPPFRTASALVGGVRVDLACTRSEEYLSPGVLPRVRPADIVTDLARRDFTVNAMAIELGPSGPGRVLDPYGGAGDLRRKRLRVLHGLSFVDDPTRAFRAARFAARLGFRVERRSRRLLAQAVRGGAVDHVSGDRIRRELARSLAEPRLDRAVRWLAGLGLLEALAPGVRPSARTYRSLGRCASLLSRRSRGGEPSSRAWVVAVALLLSEAGAGAAADLVERLRPDRTARAVLTAAPSGVSRLLRVLDRARGVPSRVVRACDGQPSEILLAARAAAGRAPAGLSIDRYLSELQHVRADVSGRDLVGGRVAPGPAVARALVAARAAKLDRAADRDEQLRVARRALDRRKAGAGD